MHGVFLGAATIACTLIDHPIYQTISHAPLPYNHRRIARGPADAAFVPAHEQAIPAHQPPIRDQTEQRELLGHDQIDMRIEHDAPHALAHEPVPPTAQSEAVMEHDDLIPCQNRAQPVVCLAVETLEERHRNRPASSRFGPVFRLPARW